MRICILSSGALASNPRVVKEASALAEVGHQVTAISVRTLDFVDRGDEAVLAAAAWRAQRLDFRARGNRWRFRRTCQMVQEAVFSLTGIDRFADRAISPFAPALIDGAKSLAADLYIAHYPAALPAAALAARTHNAVYAFDAEDFHLGDWPDGPEFEPNRHLLRAVEGRYLRNSAYVTAASPGIADAYVEAYGVTRPTVVLNVFPRAEAPATPAAAGSVEPGPSIYWFSQTIGPDRGLEAAVAAIGRARTRPHLYLRGTPATDFLERLRSIAAEVNASDRLHVLGPASPLEMVRLASIYDVGLSAETTHTLNRRIALNNKLFTYTLAGVPVLLSDIPAHRAFAAQAGSAAWPYASENADALAARIDALLGDPQSLAEARATAHRLGQTRFNWDVEKTALLDCVAAALLRAGTNRSLDER
jgi:glycosyltransferase involved in cell wall biosynthesis